MLSVISVVVNYNPETVSTDYCTTNATDFTSRNQASRVIWTYMNANKALVSSKENGAKILGTQPDTFDCCEDRYRLSQLMDSLDINYPEWSELSRVDAIQFSKKVGYPVLIRPSYVLSGAAMNVAFNEKNLIDYLNSAVGMKYASIVGTKFILNETEIEFDAVAHNGE